MTKLRTRNGSARVTAVREKPGIHRVFNLEVQTGHSYYVSALEVLSHNVDVLADSGSCILGNGPN